MVGNMLMRGMLIGIVAGILSFGFLKIVGEPAVDRAITFETAMDEAKDKAKADEAAAKGMSMPKEEPEPELVSRPVQAGIGLFTGVTVYNTAFGGLFALVYALAYRRMGDFGPRTTAALLAISGIVAVYVVPNLKYPANPPSVGDPETITMRTQLYFSMIAISLAAMIAAWMLRNRLRLPIWRMERGLDRRRRLSGRRRHRGARAAERERSARRFPGGRAVAVQNGLARRAGDHVDDDRAGIRSAHGTRSGDERQSIGVQDGGVLDRARGLAGRE